MKRLSVALTAVLLAAAPAHERLTITSALALDTTAHTATLPLYHGMASGKSVWYIITDASDANVAKRFGVNYAPALASIGDAATQRAMRSADGTYVFEGAPNFAQDRILVPGAHGFPPAKAVPGGTADDAYSPFVRAQGIAGVIDAPIVATGNGAFDVTTHRNTEDRVLAIDTIKHTVTLTLARGFFNGKPVYYISPEASDPGASAIERATFVPRLAKASPSAEIPIGVVIDGPQTGSAPQGLDYLALRTALGADATLAHAASIGAPFNVLSVAPSLAHPYAQNGYSPLWNAVVVGTPQRTRLTNYAQIAPIGKDAGFVVNCPVVAYGDENDY
jgi:hypothetical protein